jgi:peptide/nickel transport system permease protein
VKRAGFVILVAIAAVAVAAPWLAPNSPQRRFADHLYAPPTRVHILGGGGAGRAVGPYIYTSRLVNRLERRFEEDQRRAIALQWFTGGRLLSVAEGEGPLLLLGADAFGRDILARLVYGARATLALAVIATVVAILLGTLIGGIAGYAGGVLDEILSRVSDFILVLPAIYVALALRAVMPLVLPAQTVFVLLATIFALLGWPVVARGVRAIVASERTREYATASHALGAGPVRMLLRHLLPAARSYVAVQATLLLPAFILAEATLSYVGLGFPETVPTWGTMLQEAANVSLLVEAPWLLAPAAAIFVVVLAVNLAVQGGGHAPVQLEP